VTGSPRRLLVDRLPGLLPTGVARRIAVNAGWLMVERLMRMAVAFVVTVWLIRYLGPDDFGVLSYAISVATIAEVAGGLGLATIVVRAIVKTPEDEPVVVGNAAGLQAAAGALAATVAIGLIWLVDRDARTVGTVALLAGVIPLNALNTFDFTFQSKMQSRYSVAARTSGFAASTATKVVLLLAQAPLLAFAAAQALETAVTGVGFAALYARSGGSLARLRFEAGRAWGLLREAWPLAVAAAASIVYIRIDQVMLHQMVSDAELGEYAAAARLSEIWYFLPIAAGTALYPLLVATSHDPAAHTRYLQRALDVSAWSAIALALFVTIFGGVIVTTLYGDEFDASGNILRLHIWAGPFIFMGSIAGRSLIARGQQRFEASRHILGAPINIALNLILIPRYGAMGSAVATLISYAAVSYVLMLAHPRTRHLGWLMTRALALPLRSALVSRRA
jgi:PST family polysaccharide transporter